MAIVTLEKDRIVPHSTEYIVVQGDAAGPLSKKIYYTKIGQFKYRSHAELFAKQITCYNVSIIDPGESPWL